MRRGGQIEQSGQNSPSSTITLRPPSYADGGAPTQRGLRSRAWTRQRDGAGNLAGLIQHTDAGSQGG